MFPGMGGRGMSQRQMKQMMKKLGMNVNEIPDVEEIIIKTSSVDFIFKEAEVSMIDVQGQKTFQIIGEPEVVEKGTGEEEAAGIPHEDIELVAQQTGASKEEARAALEASDGNPAEAIMKLMEEQE